MSTSGDPNANQPRPISALGWVLLVLVLAGTWAVALVLIGCGGWVGYAIAGKPSAAVAGGGIGLLLFIAVLEVVLLKQTTIERGCTVVIFVVLIAAAYFAARRYEEKIEPEHSGSAAALTGADR
jgi:hypothetical protein